MSGGVFLLHFFFIQMFLFPLELIRISLLHLLSFLYTYHYFVPKLFSGGSTYSNTLNYPSVFIFLGVGWESLLKSSTSCLSLPGLMHRSFPEIFPSPSSFGFHLSLTSSQIFLFIGFFLVLVEHIL